MRSILSLGEGATGVYSERWVRDISIAVYKLRLNKQNPAGVYQVRASTTSNGQTAAASTSFTVQ